MKFFASIFLFFFIKAQPIAAQLEAEQPNLVPNAGFELFASTPLGWYYKGEHFSQALKYWTSPTATSPDAYGPKVRVPASWAEKGFGKLKAHSGSAFVGITTFGCENGKPHCREYIQIQLVEPLVPKQDYQLEFHYSNLPKSVQINNVGAYFSKKKINTKVEDPLLFSPVVYEKSIMNASGVWKKFSKKFKAVEEGEFLIIGNFFSDNQTLSQIVGKNDSLNYAYYYIDDVILKKIPPILPIPIPDDDLTKIKVVEGKVVQLKNIYFESDGFELEPRSFFELKKLLILMRRNPTMKIEVRGHTDNQGTEEYNLKLSEGRAKSVVNFLIYNGIKPYRMKSKGFGESQSMTENDTEEGRQMNRRVEFAILSK
ncbi:MAG: OmpA family protein [Saprospiraceae bacterium]